MNGPELPATGPDPPFTRASAVTQNYFAPVRDVITAETVQIQADLGTLASLMERVPERAILAPTLIDRGRQCNPLLERLDLILKPDRAAGLLAVVPGCAHDLHQALVLRCALIDFAESHGSAGPWLYLSRLEWPEGASNVDPIVRTVRDAIGLPKTYARADTEASVAKLERHICFSHFIDSMSWEEDGGALLRAWTKYFSSGALRPAPGYVVVGFLCVDIGEGSEIGRLSEFVEELRSEQTEDGPILVTRPLDMIRERHVADWVGTAARYLGDDIVEADLLDLPASLFRPESPQERLSVVYAGARDALTRTIRRAPKFREVQE